MKKNVPGQKVGAQIINPSNQSAFTGTVTVYVTLDGGTQAIGSVGSGVCTHAGNGYHHYAPSQAETNGDLVAFTFTGTSAMPVTKDFETTFPQTGDNYPSVTAIKAVTDNMATSVALAADFLAAAEADPIASNTKEVNDISIDGTGSSGDPWGPV